MTLEVTREEGKLLIAVLLYAEQEADVSQYAIRGAIKDLRAARSRLLLAYLRSIADKVEEEP